MVVEFFEVFCGYLLFDVVFGFDVFYFVLVYEFFCYFEVGDVVDVGFGDVLMSYFDGVFFVCDWIKDWLFWKVRWLFLVV